MFRLLVVGACLGLFVCGCNSPDKRLNAPPHGSAEESSDLQGTFVYMTDNAMLADMTVCDMHFLPHRSMLNDMGVQRLSRLASLIEAYGGTVRYNANETDVALIEQRLDSVRDFLSQAGLDTNGQIVAVDLPGGRGMLATEAILIKTEEGTYKPRKSGGAPAPMIGPPADNQ